jgi:membrane-associated phospholipid phosphatase
MSGVLFSRERLRNLLAIFLLFLIGTLLFGYVANQVFDGDADNFDYGILQIVRSIQNSLLNDIANIVTIFGSVAMVGLLTFFLCVYLLQLRKKKQAAFAAISVGGVLIIFSLLKLIFERDRPFLYNLIYESTYSFPSGHAALSFALALVVVILSWKSNYRLAFVASATLFIFLIGLSRVYLTVHYPTDVIAGWILAAIWVLVSALTLNIIPPSRKLRNNI